jgi:hypothetical protein
MSGQTLQIRLAYFHDLSICGITPTSAVLSRDLWTSFKSFIYNIINVMFMEIHITPCLSIYLSINHLWLYSLLLGPCRFFSFLILYTPWTEDQPIPRPLPTQDNTQTQNKSAQRHPCLSGIRTHEPSVRAKTVHVLDRVTTVVGITGFSPVKFNRCLGVIYRLHLQGR